MKEKPAGAGLCDAGIVSEGQTGVDTIEWDIVIGGATTGRRSLSLGLLPRLEA